MGRLFVVSAPSGAGKTTLCRMLLARSDDLVYSISTTTRQPRPGETDGRDYFFVAEERFKEMIAQGALLEWAEVFGRYYGTGRRWVESQLALGKHVLVDVDVDGARQIKENFSEAVLIFIVPPTMAELSRRLRGRETETEEQMEIRLGRARAEIEARDLYDYLIVNDEVQSAAEDLAAVTRAEGLRMAAAEDFWPGFFSEP